jgi:hypothetical protein
MLKLSGISASAVLLATALAGTPASAGYFGSLSLQPGQTQKLNVGTVTRNVRVCNEFGSAGSASVVIADNPAHHLMPGQCAEDTGDRLLIQSMSGGPVQIDWRVIIDQGGHRQFED